MISEAHGIPLAVCVTGGNRNDITQLMPLIEAIPPVRGRRGRPRQRPGRTMCVLGNLSADPVAHSRVIGFARDPAQPGWIRAGLADELGDVRLLQEIEFPDSASSGSKAGEWYRDVTGSGKYTAGQRLLAALALAERRDEGWQPLVEARLTAAALSPENRFQASRRLSQDPEGTDLLRRLATHPDLDISVPALAALTSAKDERARQMLNEIRHREGAPLRERFPQLDAWREEVGPRTAEPAPASGPHPAI